MKRVIIDYEKLTVNILELLVEKYPNGYEYRDIITFQNAAGKTIHAVEVRTEDTVYLVKISQKLEDTMDDFIESDGDFDDGDFYHDVENDDDDDDF